MADSRFFKREGPFSAGQIASLTGGRCTGDAAQSFDDITALERADASCLTFFTNPRMIDDLATSQAGGVLLNEKNKHLLRTPAQAILCADPYRAMAQVAQHFYPLAARARPMPGELQEGQQVHATARLEEGVAIGFGALIGPGVEIGRNSVIGAGAIIGHGVAIGRACVIGANVSIGYALLGDRVIIHNGTSIGQDGFGFAPGAEHTKIPQLGRVIIQADVEIGSQCAIDRGTVGDTTIGEGSKLDNLVHLAHNVVVGRHCFLTAGVGVAGSSTLGDYVQMGGHAGVTDHVSIGSNSVVAAKAAVLRSFPANSKISGVPARPRREVYRDQVFLSRLRKKTKS